MNRLFLLIFFGVIIFSGSILLQIFLSKQKNKWLGLVLPALYLIIAFIGSSGLMMYDGQILPILIGFFLLSIPTIILLLIHFAIRGKKNGNHKDEMEKMNIQDL